MQRIATETRRKESEAGVNQSRGGKKKKGCMKSPHAEIPEGVAVMAHPGSANLLEKVFIWNMPAELLF